MAERGTQKLFGLAVATALVALPAAATAQETQRSDTAIGSDTSRVGATQHDTSRMGAAQHDTTQQDSSRWGYDANQNPDTQNPPGYRGMERPVNVFPPDSAGEGQQQQPGRVDDQGTGTYDDSAWRDTTGQRQNPAGYRGMERPVGADTSQAAQRQGQTGQPTGDRGSTQELEQYRQRLGEMGYKIEKMSKSEKKDWQKRNRTSGTGADTQRQGGTGREATSGGDTTRVGETTPKVPADSTRRLPAARGDTTGQSSSVTGQDATGRETTGATSSDTSSQ